MTLRSGVFRRVSRASGRARLLVTACVVFATAVSALVPSFYGATAGRFYLSQVQAGAAAAVAAQSSIYPLDDTTSHRQTHSAPSRTHRGILRGSEHASAAVGEPATAALPVSVYAAAQLDDAGTVHPALVARTRLHTTMSAGCRGDPLPQA